MKNKSDFTSLKRHVEELNKSYENIPKSNQLICGSCWETEEVKLDSSGNIIMSDFINNLSGENGICNHD